MSGARVKITCNLRGNVVAGGGGGGGTSWAKDRKPGRWYRRKVPTWRGARVFAFLILIILGEF
jgi:hypothetical protein